MGKSEAGAQPSDADPSQVSAANDGQVTVWRRWTEEGDVPFHEYCVLKPTRPPLSVFHDTTADTDAYKYPEGTEPPLSYAPPLARWALRHTPLLVLIATVLYVIVHFGTLAVRTTRPFFASVLTLPAGITVLALIVWMVILALLIRSVLSFPSSESLKGGVVYGLLIFLTSGLFVGMYVATPDFSVPVSTPVVDALTSFPFAFLWMLLVGGHLVYDGMLRTENMFVNLGNKMPPIIGNEGAYEEFLTDLRGDLNASIELADYLPTDLVERGRLPTEIPKASLFAVVFVAPFFFVWWLVPTGEDPISNFALRGVAAFLPAVLDVFLVIVFFQFLILIAYFNRLLTDHTTANGDGDGIMLLYNPEHPDNYAGFRDLGSFATRVNVLLIVGGIYEAYHLYVRGFRTALDLSQGLTLGVVSWGVSSILPLVTYLFAVVVWLYLSFWQLHKTMRRGREQKLEELVQPTDDSDDTYADETVEKFRDGPVWPINSRLLLSLVSMDLMPLLTLLPFLRF